MNRLNQCHFPNFVQGCIFPFQQRQFNTWGKTFRLFVSVNVNEILFANLKKGGQYLKVCFGEQTTIKRIEVVIFFV